MNSQLHIYNTLSKEKEEFQPIKPPFVGMYVCGPTVYSSVHLGNCRTFISFDVIFRYLKYLGYKVRYVRNITDAGHLENDADEGEDKISKKARLEQIEPMEVVQKYTVDFHNVLQQFNNLPPSIEPTATGHIVEQIDMINDIVKAGYAYESNGSVYFDTKKFDADKGYGELSGRNIEELLSGTRALDGQSEKKSPVDFALWKKASPTHIMRWNSPWSVGFPGWHLECSVMSRKYLGEQFDIHGGGMDLKFPHHECEVAQNKAVCSGEPTKYWMHANMLTLNGAKMSKSTGNTLLPHELFSGDNDILDKAFHPIVVRFFMMQAHYRSILDFSNDALEAAEKGYTKLFKAIKTLESIKVSKETSFDVDALIDSFYAAMNDDFNTPILVANLFEVVKQVNLISTGKESISQIDLERLKKELHAFVYDVLGLKEIEEGGDDETIDKLVKEFIDMRVAAKKEKNFELADQIRNKLLEMGIALKDSREGTTWEKA